MRSGQPVHVNFETAPGEVPDLARSLAERGDVRYVSLLAGTRDIMCELISPNRQELDRLLMGQLQKSEAMQRTTTAVAIKPFKTSDQWSGSLLGAVSAADANGRELTRKDAAAPSIRLMPDCSTH